MGLLKSLFGRRERTPADLAKWLDLPEAELRAWLGSSPAWARGYEYARFDIPKRRGGVRTIEAPNDKLKELQRRILHRLLNPLPAHPASTGFVPRRSIVDNARPHVGRGVVINLDLADFFPGIPAERVAAAFRGLGWSAEAATLLSRICTSEGHLPQGAPTSPAVSNLICRRLDVRLTALAKANGGAYTRYADDLTFSFDVFGRNKRLRRKPPGRPPQPRPSGKTVSRAVLTTIRKIIEEEGFKVQLRKKVRVQRPHQRQSATGLVVNDVVNLPRATRRLIRAMRHRQRVGRLDETGLRRLRGLEAFAMMVARQR
jgi:retron-type reverse transcriptase